MAEIKFEKDIRIAPEVCVSFPCRVNGTGVVAGENGKKWILAGTPIGGTTNFFENRQVELVVANGANAQGVVLHDVDVTSGSANATILVEGYVDLLKLDSTVSISLEAKTALDGKVVFMKGHR